MTFRPYVRAAAIAGAAVALVLATAAPAAAAISRDRTPPSAPTGLRVTAVTHTSLTMAWNPSTDNRGVKLYTMWVDGLGLGVIAVNHPTTIATWSLGLRPGTAYTLNVAAWDASGNGSTTSRLATSTTPDVTAPTTPTGLEVGPATQSTVLLNWLSSTDNVDPARYEILVNGTITTDALSTRPAGTPSTWRSGAWIRQLPPGTNHTIAVRARDGSGNVSAPSTEVTVVTAPSTDVTAPTAPVLLSASDGGTSYCPEEIWTRWSGSTDNRDAPTAIEYELRVNGVINEVIVGRIGTVAYTEVLGANTVTIVAVDAAGNASAPSAPISVRTNWGFGSHCPG